LASLLLWQIAEAVHEDGVGGRVAMLASKVVVATLAASRSWRQKGWTSAEQYYVSVATHKL
jgi:hypothetical protein